MRVINPNEKFEEVKPMYNLVELLDKLYKEVENEEEVEKRYYNNKYVAIKEQKSLVDWRCVSLHQLINKELFGLFGNVYREFFNEVEDVIFIFSTLNGTPVSLVMRSLKDKQFYDVSLSTNIPYGLGSLPSDFKYGDWLWICEGIFDKEVADIILERYRKETGKRIFPIAKLSSSITLTKAEIYTKLTNKFVLNPDNDEAGKNSISSDKKNLFKYNPSVEIVVVENPIDLKDIGDTFLEYDRYYPIYESELLKKL